MVGQELEVWVTTKEYEGILGGNNDWYHDYGIGYLHLLKFIKVYT